MSRAWQRASTRCQRKPVQRPCRALTGQALKAELEILPSVRRFMFEMSTIASYLIGVPAIMIGSILLVLGIMGLIIGPNTEGGEGKH